MNDPEKFILGAAGGTFPKSAVGLPQGLGGASPLTTTPSTLAHLGQKCFKIPRYIVQGARGFGRFFSPIFIGYGLGMATVEIGCAAACGDNSNLY